MIRIKYLLKNITEGVINMSDDEQKEIMFKILKAVMENERDLKYATFNINKKKFIEISRLLKDKGYLEELHFTNNDVHYFDARITLDGKFYVLENMNNIE